MVCRKTNWPIHIKAHCDCCNATFKLFEEGMVMHLNGVDEYRLCDDCYENTIEYLHFVFDVTLENATIKQMESAIKTMIADFNEEV